MASGKATNHHFKKTVEGLPKELMPLLGQGLQALADKREGNDVQFAALINKALLKLSVTLIESQGSSLNSQQRLALCSGLLADTIELKSKSGKRVVIELVPADLYERLLSEIEEDAESTPYLLYPHNRLRAIASGILAPLNLDRPGRYKEPQKSKGAHVSPQQLQSQWLAARDQLQTVAKQLAVSKAELLNVFSSARMGDALASLAEFEKLAVTALTSLPDVVAVQEGDAANLINRPKQDAALVNFEHFSGDTGKVLAHLNSVLQELNQRLVGFQNSTTALRSSETAGENPGPAPLALKADDAAVVVADIKAVNQVMEPVLKSRAKKSQFLFARMLLGEQTEGVEDPGAKCYASPTSLIASIKKINAINPNCFPQDGAGMPIMPPVVIEPGAGIIRWLDDRFVLGFVSGETQIKGPKVSFSQLDVSVMTMFGLFMARGELFDYRGNRISGNFMADYSSQVESKAVAKFAGDAKKLTYTTSTQEKDSASRDDAVRDYIEFLYNVMNGLPIPKKISPRKISVILKYCIIKDVRFTAGLVLKYVPGFDELVARELITDLSGKNKSQIVILLQQVMEDDQLIRNKYRNDLETALREVMGRGFAEDAKDNGLLGGKAGTADSPAPAAGSVDGNQAETEHDFFDL